MAPNIEEHTSGAPGLVAPPALQRLLCHGFIGVPVKGTDLTDPVVGLGPLLRRGAGREGDDYLHQESARKREHLDLDLESN